MEKENRTNCDSYHTRLISKSNPHIVNLEKKENGKKQWTNVHLSTANFSKSFF